MKKKIGIDFTYIRADEPSGIRKGGEDILEGLAKINKDFEIVLFVDESLKESFERRFPQYKLVVMKVWFKNIKYLRSINNRTIAKLPKIIKIKKEKCDIILHPYTEKLTPLIKGQLKISTILDVIPLDIIEDKKSKKYIKVKQAFIKLMNKSENIVTISQYSKKRLLEVKPNYKGTMTVIPNAIAKLSKSEKNVQDIIKSDKPYIFSINSFLKHKNQITLVKAFDQIKEKVPQQLILVGRPELDSGMSGYNDILKYIEDNNLKNRIQILSNLSDEDRNALFYNTDLFVSTSLQEGFGRTPVEAAMCKVPVISTRETSLPEATKDMVFYYDNATDSSELAEKMLYVLNNKPTSDELEKIAKTLEKEYDERKIANQYIELIKELLG